MEPYDNDLQNDIGESNNKSIKGKRVAEDLSSSVRREYGAQSQYLQNEGQTSSRRGYNQEIYRPKIRKKNPTYCSLEPLANFPDEDGDEIMKDSYKWKRYQHGSTGGPHFPSFSYKCTYPGCTTRMHTERVSLHPDKIMVSYEGVHNHNDIPVSLGQLSVKFASQKPVSSQDLQQFPCLLVSQNQKLASQYEVQEDIVQRLQSTSVHIMKLDQYIEHLKPNYGIFLNHPSKIKYGVMDDHVAESTASICGMSSSQGGYGEPHQAFYAMNNVCHSPLYSNGIHNPYHSQKLQQVNNAVYHSIPFPGHFSSAEPSISLGIQCTNSVMAGGEIISEGQTILESQHIQGLMQHQQQLESLGAVIGDITFQYNLMQGNHNAGYNTFQPLTYEQTSSSSMAGGGYVISGVIDVSKQLQWIHPSYAQLNGDLTEN